MGRIPKYVWKRMKLLLIISFVSVLFMCALLFFEGYTIYRDAVRAVPVSKMVESIQSDESYVSLEEISPYFVAEIIRTEDKRFYRHPGFDVLAIMRAAKNDILAMSFVEGGSTITVQLAKNMYFEFDKVLTRKVAEIFAAVEIEKTCPKDEILEVYLNFINYGEGCFGIKEAAEHYYGVSPMELTEEQADALVYTIKCPEEFNPNAMA